MNKIVLYDCKNMGCWELLMKTICFKRIAVEIASEKPSCFLVFLRVLAVHG